MSFWWWVGLVGVVVGWDSRCCGSGVGMVSVVVVGWDW